MSLYDLRSHYKWKAQALRPHTTMCNDKTKAKPTKSRHNENRYWLLYLSITSKMLLVIPACMTSSTCTALPYVL